MAAIHRGRHYCDRFEHNTQVKSSKSAFRFEGYFGFRSDYHKIGIAATQVDWRRVMGKLPGELTAELPEGGDTPVGNVNTVIFRDLAVGAVGATTVGLAALPFDFGLNRIAAMITSAFE